MGLLKISGEGTARGKFNIATLYASVAISGKINDEVTAQCNLKMEQVFRCLRDYEISEDDYTTNNYRINQTYGHFLRGKKKGQSYPNGWMASNGVQVTVRDLTILPHLLSALTPYCTQISSPSFAISDPAALMDVARAKAVQNAMDKATVYAKACNHRIVELSDLQERGSSYQDSAYGSGSAAMCLEAAPAAAPPSINAGAETVTVHVNTEFKISPLRSKAKSAKRRGKFKIQTTHWKRVS